MGELLKGSSIRNGIVYLCEQCYDGYKILEDLNNYNKGTEPINDYKGNADIPDFFKDIFNKK